MSDFDILAREFLAQKRIAVAGASRDSKQTANTIMNLLREKGYEVFAVNPNALYISGETCYPDLQSIPGGVDGVLIFTRPEVTPQIVADAIEAGVPRVWMHDNTLMPGSSSEEAIRLGRENGLTVIPAGCPMMYFDFAHKCMKWALGAVGRLPKG